MAARTHAINWSDWHRPSELVNPMEKLHAPVAVNGSRGSRSIARRNVVNVVDERDARGALVHAHVAGRSTLCAVLHSAPLRAAAVEVVAFVEDRLSTD